MSPLVFSFNPRSQDGQNSSHIPVPLPPSCGGQTPLIPLSITITPQFTTDCTGSFLATLTSPKTVDIHICPTPFHLKILGTDVDRIAKSALSIIEHSECDRKCQTVTSLWYDTFILWFSLFSGGCPNAMTRD